MKRRLFSLLLTALCTFWCANAADKMNLKVLYVSGSADLNSMETPSDSLEYKASIRERSASWAAMLKTYFTQVDVVDAKEYKQEMSKNYDVTVLDAKPKPIKERKIYYDEKGVFLDMDDAVYFTEDFDRPVITIAEVGNSVGRCIGIKNDWLCLCLDADAHHLVKRHPIFKGPFKVKLTMKTKPTPESAFEYAYFVDEKIPAQIPMWEVQTKGYKTDPHFRIGMVARPWGYTDSPDAEYISSGVCAKTIDAVAIGRHANFLHWGFAASPRFMTEEAKTVFANAVVYISKFAGCKPIARKYNDHIATRECLKEKKYLATRTAYEERLKSDEKWNADLLKEQQAVKDKQAAGKTITKMEEQLLEYTPSPKQSYEEFVKRYNGDLFDQFGADEQAYIRYYDENKPYFYGGKGMYVITVDDDVKSLGIANSDKRLLDKAISLWESGQDVTKAKRILYRYTLLRYDNARQWREWYNRYQSKLFFTESGGWLYLVNSNDAGTPGNDYSVLKKEESKEKLPTLKEETTVTNPVSISANVESGASGKKQIVIRVKIHDGFHIYAMVSPKDPFIKTEMAFEPSKSCQLEGKLVLPPASILNADGTTIYTGDVIFRQNVSGKGTVKVTIRYQCCDSHACLMPQEKEITVNIQ